MVNIRYLYIVIVSVFLSSVSFAQELSIQTGHASTVLDLAFSPDGNILASSGADNKIVLWDMISSKQMNILSGHNAAVNSISIHPNKNIIASASDDATVKIWEYPSGKLLTTYHFFETKVKAVTFSPDGKQLACGSEFVYLIDMETKKHIKLAQHAKSTFNALAYSNDGVFLAFGEKNAKKNYVYNLSSKKIVKEFKIKSKKLLFSADNSSVYIAGNRGIVMKKPLFKTKGKTSKFKQLAGYSWNSFNSIVIYKDCLVAANTDNLIYIYNKKSGKKIEILKAHSDDVMALAVNKKGRYVASAGKDRTIIIWDIDERKVIKTLEGGTISANTISFSGDGNTMFIGYADGSFKTWDLASKSNIEYASFSEGQKQRLFSKPKNYSTQNTVNPIDAQRILVKVNRIELDKYTGELAAEYENLAYWNAFRQNEIKKLINNKSGVYQNYFIVDTSMVIAVEVNATHSQTYSLLNHERILDAEEVFSIDVSTCNIVTKKKELKLAKKKSFRIEGAIYYKNISADGKFIVIVKKQNAKSMLEVWDIQKRSKLNEKEFAANVNSVVFSPKNKYLCVGSDDNEIVILHGANLEAVTSLKGTAPVSFSDDENSIVYTNSDKELFLYDIDGKSVIFNVNTKHQTQVSDIKFNEEYNYIATSSYDGLIKFWSAESGSMLLSMAVFNDNDFIYVSPENYYFSTKRAMNYIGFLYKDKLYSFEQFDLKFNRPDIVFAKSAYSNPQEINAFYKAYLKRIKKLGFNKDAFDSDFNIPLIAIENARELPILTSENTIDLRLNLIDSLYNLDRLNVWINDVAIYGTKGVDLKEEGKKQIYKNLKLELAQGKNKIQVSCLNQKGVESFKETVVIKYEPKNAVEPNLYLITIGTSKYLDNNFNLQYAAKDAKDVAELFKKDHYFNKVIVKTLTDEQVTKENIEKLKLFLADATINDEVIIFVAGHGVLDVDLNYYLASHDMDFNDPAKRGIPYEDVEKLLDGIKPLKKILFVDACHSGEIDKDEMELAQVEATEQGEVTFRAAGASVVSKSVETQNTSELSKELFTDLRRGTGATVVSSAGGGEYAMESGEWKNGLFTYCLINGIQTKEADLNKDGKIMLSELQKYVQSQVLKLSGGKQQPTSRIENISSDFRVW